LPADPRRCSHARCRHAQHRRSLRRRRKLTSYWASQEEHVDWQRPGLPASRCTTAFAATELRHYLERTAPSWQFRFLDHLPAAGPAVVIGPAAVIERTLGLRTASPLKDPQSYAIHSTNRHGSSVLLLAGGGREGALYAVYSYLAELGWRWYAPGKHGEVAPPVVSAPRLDGWNITSAPDFPLFRGFLTAPDSLESTDMFRWMARNRLNAWAYRPRPYALMKKLGFRFVTGGHILEDIMNPDAPQPDGRTLFETHPDWFPEVNGKRLRENATRYQFCVSNAAATSFAARRIVEHFATDWRWTDYQNAWMLDTWTGWCQCARCRALGNDTDRYLHFLSRVRAIATEAENTGRLRRSPGMLLCAYEGTPSLEGPSRALPANLASGRDLSLFAPINRCYAHQLNDPRCTELNTHYARALESWGSAAARFPLAVVEYYNCSKVEDLPVLFTRTMGSDYAYYKSRGVKAITYMHPPIALEGPRALNNMLVARLSWDVNAPVDQIKEEYIRRYYGPAAVPMRRFYDNLEAAYANLTAWRSWHASSVMWKLLHWDASPPVRPLFSLRHLQPEGGQSTGPLESLEDLDRARAALDAALRLKASPDERFRIEEDARAFRYADDSFRFFWAMCQVYQAEARKDDAAARLAFHDVERFAASLVSYYVPFDYTYPGVGFSAKDGLERTQLRPLYNRLKQKYAPIE